MYAACMWVVDLLLVLSDLDSVFLYVPEYYFETLVLWTVLIFSPF
jgi:Kip1 ubiquitination-promoting complex protein 1